MKIKKDKMQEKLCHEFYKKTKLSNPSIENVDFKNVTQSTPANNDKSLKSLDGNIFSYFKELTSDEENTRMEAALHLLKQIHRTEEPGKVKFLNF